MKYVALLLSVNLGKRTVKMADLAKCLENLGYKNVKTLLASGNVVFEADTKPDKKWIEQKLEETFGFSIKIILLSYEEVSQLVKENPFKNVTANLEAKFYITFFVNKVNKTLQSEISGIKVVGLTSDYIAWVVHLTSGFGTTEGMKLINKTFGTENTTRNWNTIQKIAAL